MRSLILSILLLLTAGISARGQAPDTLTLDEALATGLKNNYDILISRNDAIIANNNNTLGMAGFFPVIGPDLNYLTTTQKVDQKFANGTEQHLTNATNKLLTSGMELNWTVFDGFRMFAAHDRLKALDAAGQANLRNQIQTTSSDIINTYLFVVRQQQLIKVTREAIRLSGTRLDLAKTRYELGSGNKQDYLQAKVDMNADSTLLLQQIAGLGVYKQRLNYLMSIRNGPTGYAVEDTIYLLTHLTLPDLQEKLLRENPEVISAERLQDAANASIREARAAQYPTVSLGSRYNYLNQVNQAGFTLLFQTIGYNYGATIGWTIFNGGVLKVQVRNAKLNANSAALATNRTRTLLSSRLNEAYAEYEANTAIIKLVQDNMGYASQNQEIAYERYKLGRASLLEYRQAQLTYIDALNRLLDAVYTAKISETLLLRLSGQIRTR